MCAACKEHHQEWYNLPGDDIETKLDNLKKVGTHTSAAAAAAFGECWISFMCAL